MEFGRRLLTDCPTCRTLDNANAGVLGTRAQNVGGLNSVDPNFRPPESWQWNLTVSHEVMKNTVAEVSYLGTTVCTSGGLINAVTTRCCRSFEPGSPPAKT